MVTQSKNNDSPILDFYEDLKISPWEKNETKMDEKGEKIRLVSSQNDSNQSDVYS